MGAEEEVFRDVHQPSMSPFIQQTSNEHLLCAGAGLGAEHPTANNTHLTVWWASQEINIILIQCESKIIEKGRVGRGKGGWFGSKM